ncbi:electron transfer flavoprotein subunit alpha/FixB family protein [Oligoflexaceae bacterium]|nr:electron transfer flavoprotein subunit alpha/FixB family protein [Oligoflexaceae bacterium]
MKVLVFAEQRNGKLKSSAFEALTAARDLAGDSAQIGAVIIGDSSNSLASELQGYGADTVFCAEDAALKDYNCIAYSASLDAAIKEFSPNLVIGIASPMGRDMFPRLAARHSAAMLTDLVSISASGENISGVKPMYAGKCLAKVATKGSGIQFVTLRQNVFAASKSETGSATAQTLSVTIPSDSTLKTTEVRAGKSEKPDLTEASIIISGGRSLGNAENFQILTECADVIGATVGASRAAVDAGYASHDMQVGQTGKTVNPNLYIACGISGAVQHMAGMRTSKIIVAVNTDEDAPIFKVADYGIVGDLFEVVPAMTKQFKALLS